MVTEKYKARHNNVARINHQELIKKLIRNTELLEPHYKYTHNSVVEDRNYKILWDRTVKTPCNRPEIIVWDKVNKTIQLIEVAVPHSNNMQLTYE